ncbi:hypothetical protein DFH09DRAFT_435186 [Mycena vulgaris]|nr:hypothetical protein DFH09DRAFT_435186 [Mycena vulgaris]
MVFLANILFSACVLPSVMGLILNTPAGATDDATVVVTWTTVATDPKFSLLLVSATEAFDVAQGIDPTTLNTTVGLGNIPPGAGYKLQAVVADDIDTVPQHIGRIRRQRRWYCTSCCCGRRKGKREGRQGGESGCRKIARQEARCSRKTSSAR